MSLFIEPYSFDRIRLGAAFVKSPEPRYNDRDIREIRIRMRKGSCRRLSAPLAGVLLVLGLPAAFPLTRPSSGPAWWEVRLTVAVKGEYSLEDGNEPITGEYACRARWEGRLEPEGDDFLLVHLKTEILDWSLKEKAGPRGRENVLETPDGPRPLLHLNYVLKDGQKIEFDFDLQGVPIPLHASPLELFLELPNSTGPGEAFPERGYGDFVHRGSNRIVVQAADLERRTRQRKFSWEWRHERRLVVGYRDVMFTQSHAAESLVSLVAH
jgi:hypothetical protein